ncbi:MAG: CBU_0592 family membrane protein [Caulobacteraceae bacterium]
MAAYAGAQVRRLDPLKAPSLALNLAGAGLILLSLARHFNLAAFLMEAAWAAVAAGGLIRLAFSRRNDTRRTASDGLGDGRRSTSHPSSAARAVTSSNGDRTL